MKLNFLTFNSLLFLCFILNVAQAQSTIQTLGTMRPALPITSLAYSPNGRVLISASTGDIRRIEGFNEIFVKHHTGGIQLWNAQTGDLQKTITLKSLPVFRVAISPDSRTFATAHGTEIRLWNFPAATLRRRITNSGTSIAFSPDGKLLACGTYNPQKQLTVTLFDSQTGNVKRTIVLKTTDARNSSQAVHVSFSSDGKTLAANDDNVLATWDTTDFSLTRVVEDKGMVFFSPTMPIAASLCELLIGPDMLRNQVVLWDTKTWKRLKDLTHQDESGIDHATTIVFSPDGRTLAAGTEWKVRLWNPDTGLEISKPLPTTGWVSALTFSPDGKILAQGGEKGITLWRL